MSKTIKIEISYNKETVELINSTFCSVIKKVPILPNNDLSLVYKTLEALSNVLKPELFIENVINADAHGGVNIINSVAKDGLAEDVLTAINSSLRRY